MKDFKNIYESMCYVIYSLLDIPSSFRDFSYFMFFNLSGYQKDVSAYSLCTIVIYEIKWGSSFMSSVITLFNLYGLLLLLMLYFMTWF